MTSITSTKSENNFVTTIKVKSHDTAIANTIRRVLISEIPTYSVDIDSIKIKENTSIYHNERIFHILTMIYIKNNDSKLNYDDVSFSLTGIYDKKNTTDEKIMIYSDNIRSSNGKKYFHPGMPIIELRKGESLIIDSFSLKKDIQSTHAQFQACIVKYNIIKLPSEIDVEIHPCSIYNGESYPYKTKDIAKIVINVIIQKIKTLKENIMKGNVIIESTYSDGINLSTIIINNENDTIGYLLQSHIMNMKEYNNFIGYKNIHPLKHKLVVKLIHEKPKELLLKTLTEIQKKFEKLKSK